MDVNVVSGLISNLGFPIVCVIALFYLQIKERESHRQEMNEITKAVNNNTLMVQRLLERIDEHCNVEVFDDEERN